MALAFRPATTTDIEYARSLCFETMRWIIKRLFGWDEATEVEKFAKQFVPEETSIITFRGTKVGWLQTSVRDNCVFLAQVYIEPGHQGQGLGTQAIRMVIGQADELGLPVRLGVVRFNPALGLYERLGFKTVGEDQYKFYMERPASN
jgi:GNAT superfamily N-acetyltransferase